MADSKDPKAAIEGEVLSALELQQQLNQLETELMGNERFKQFIELRSSVNDKWADVRKQVEAIMIPAYQAGKIDKTLKADWGTITVTESDKFKIDEKLLPAKFFKKVVDEKKVRTIFQLEGTPPKGTEQYKKYGIMIKVKEDQDNG